MAWRTKNRVQQDGGDEEIRTPDNQQILVGAVEDQVLLYQVAFENWGLKTRTNQSGWGLKTKVEQAGWVNKTKIVQS